MPWLIVALGLIWHLPRAEAASQTAGAPRLVVVIVIDQLRGDFLPAFSDRFVEGGFRRLMDGGAWFTDAQFDYGALATGPGHASLATGSTPSVHGIVGNDWYVPDEGGRQQYCCGDDRVEGIGLLPGVKAGGRSARQLAVNTLGDQLKAHTAGQAKVWSVALKDRSAVLTAGHRADGAVWWDAVTGRLVSSTYYGPNLPAWAASLNAAHFADEFFQTPWDLLLPEAAYSVRFVQPASEESYRKYHAGEFPKVLGRGLEKPGPAYYGALYASPFGNEIVFGAARRAIVEEKLGGDEVTDLIWLGLSSNDLVGHLFGPDSKEVMDCTLRTDRQISAFLTWLDGQVGLEKCVVALSSDHGVGPVVEYAAAAGLGGDRLDAGEFRRFVEAGVGQRFPLGEGGKSPIRDVIFPWLYFDEGVLRDAGVSIDEAARAVAEIAVRYEGIARAFAAPDIRSPDFVGSDELRRCVRNSYFPGRSGHVYLHWERYWYKGRQTAGHGSAHDYDRFVPVLLLGPGIKPGRYNEPVSPTGMTVTLCALLGVDPPAGVNGVVWREVLATAK